MTTTYTVEMWVVTAATSEFGGKMAVDADSADDAVSAAEVLDWARGGDFGDAESVTVRLIVRGAGGEIAAENEEWLDLRLGS
jgi:hypothetical protein